MSIAFVCIMGIATVFIGLVCLIFIIKIANAVCDILAKGEKSNNVQSAPAPKNQANVQNRATAPITNKQEIIAGVCAVIAEELGTEVSNIRVTSFKKL